MHQRLKILIISCISLFSLLGVSLFYLQIASGEEYTALATTARVREITTHGARGQILDRYGRVLATNVSGYDIVLNISDVKTAQLNTSILSALTIMRACEVDLQHTIAITSDGGIPAFQAQDIQRFLKAQELDTTLTAQEALTALRTKFGIPQTFRDAEAANVIAIYLNAGATAYQSLSESKRLQLLDISPQYGSPFIFEDDGKVKLREEVSLLDPQSLLLLTQACTELSLESPCRSALPIAVGQSGAVWNTNAIQELRKYAKAASNTTAQEVLAALVERYDAQDVPAEYLLDVLAVRLAISELGYKAYNPLVLGTSSDAVLCAIISENAESMPGISLNQTYTRYYPYGEVLCQTLGYIGRITAETKDAYEALGYNIASDLVGRDGLEAELESYLRPGTGVRRVSVDSLGRAVTLLQETSAQDGMDVVLTIDLDLQIAAEQALDEAMEKIRTGGYNETYPNALVGAAAAVDIHTGEVLALASRPGYDPNLFTSTITDELWEKLNPTYDSSDATLPRPMVNAALQVVAPPGSTYKTVTAAAALNEHVTTRTETVLDQGRYTYFSEVNAPACWTWNDTKTTHGEVNVTDALAHSCNYYFYEMGTRLGISKLEEYAVKFGLGQKTGIELTEASGSVGGQSATNAFVASQAAAQVAAFTKQDKSRYVDELETLLSQFSMERAYQVLTEFGLSYDQFEAVYTYMDAYRWRESSIVSSAIGQGNTNVSVLQMAQVAAAVTSNGIRYRPTLILSVPEAGISLEPEQVSDAFLSDADGQAIRDGMKAALQKGGTAYSYFKDCDIAISGKTGTAQSEGRDAYAWFIAYAPSDDPQIAVAVMIGQGGHGAYAAPVARTIIETYFTAREGTPIPTAQGILD